MLKVAITFDDGRLDNYEIAIPLLEKYGIKATFFIIAKLLDNDFDIHDSGYQGKYMNQDMIQSLMAKGFEIGSHSYSHSSMLQDIIIGHSRLVDFCGRDEKMGLSLPNSLLADGNIEEIFKQTNGKVAYIRGGRNINCKSLVSKARFIVLSASHSNRLYCSFNKPNVLGIKKAMPLDSVVVKNGDRPDNLLGLVVRHSDEKAMIIFMFHSICDDKDDWSWSRINFERFLTGIRLLSTKNSIQTGTLKDLLND